MTKFFIQIDGGNNVVAISQNDHSKDKNWYEIQIGKKYLNNFKHAYNDYEFDPDENILRTPDLTTLDETMLHLETTPSGVSNNDVNNDVSRAVNSLSASIDQITESNSTNINNLSTEATPTINNNRSSVNSLNSRLTSLSTNVGNIASSNSADVISNSNIINKLAINTTSKINNNNSLINSLKSQSNSLSTSIDKTDSNFTAIDSSINSNAKVIDNLVSSNNAKMNSLTNSNSAAIQSLASKQAPKINDNSSLVNSLEEQLTSLSSFVAENVHGKPINIFPNYWVDSSHNDPHTFHVSVKDGITYTLSFVIASNPSGVPIRANSEWNIGDQWGDVVQNDTGAVNVGDTYQITFTANQTGNMPIEFIHTNAAKAIQNGPSMMIKQITMIEGSDYTPYSKCDNSKQSLADVTGDAGMDAKTMFGNL